MSTRIVTLQVSLEVDEDFDAERLHEVSCLEFAEAEGNPEATDGWVDDFGSSVCYNDCKGAARLVRLEVDGLTKEERHTVHYLHDQGQDLDDIVDQTGYRRPAIMAAIVNYAK